MTSLTDIIAKFEASFEAFETTDARPNDLYVTQIYDAIAKIFYPIRYDSVGARHNLMGLIDEDAAYATEYGKSFPGRIARVSTLQILIQRKTLPSTAERRRLSTRQRFLTGKYTMWPKVRLIILLSASSRMFESLHFRRGALLSMQSGKRKSCWTSSRLSAQVTKESTCWRSRTKCGRCM